MATIHKLSEYEIKKDDEFLFDANIWIYLHYGLGSYNTRTVDMYSEFYGKILENGNRIYTNSLIISEIINRLERIEFDRVKRRDGLSNYKRDFRNNKDYKELLMGIRLLVKEKILNNAVCINDCFETFDYAQYVLGDKLIDFNDAMHCFGAVDKNMKIVTNDSDFKQMNSKIEVITIN